MFRVSTFRCGFNFQLRTWLGSSYYSLLDQYKLRKGLGEFEPTGFAVRTPQAVQNQSIQRSTSTEVRRLLQSYIP